MNFFKKSLPWLILIAIVVGLAVPKLISQPSAQPGGPVQAEPQVVRTIQVQSRNLNETIRLNGSLLAEESVDIRSEVTGKIESIHFAEDSKVEGGQLLLKIDDRELRSQLAAVSQRLEFSKLQEERQRRLLSEGGTTQAAYDEARNNLNVLMAEKDLLQVRVDKTEIRAPFDGVIGLRHVSPGALVQPTTSIASLVKINNLRVDFAVPERYLSSVRTGMVVNVRVVGVDQVFTGEVIAREPKIDPATRTLTLRARIDNSQDLLLPGAFASVELMLNEFPEALMLPSAAIIPGLNQNAVFLVRDGKVERRVVQLGMRTQDEVHIVGGLQPNEEVIVVGIQRVRPGQPVRAVRTDI